MANSFFISEACMALRPNNGVKIDEGNIIWTDPTDIPTDEEINTKATELENAEPLRLLRKERTKLLIETDWMALSDVPLSDEWKDYRQALRDIPSNYTSLDNVVWPTKPT
tara:strand:+ start:172 stop:501 length:330 start_codon:yes stop_codon:yes gene_type:complete